MAVLRFLHHLTDRLFVVAGAFLGMQIPEFIQQYTQRLAGHVEELSRFLREFQRMASYSGKTLDEYIHKFLTQTDPDFIHQGELMQATLSRWQALSNSWQQLVESSSWNRLYVFLTHLQPDIAKSTLSSFVPGMSLTIEGLCYGGLGIVIGYSSYRLLIFLMKGLYQTLLVAFPKKSSLKFKID